MFKLKSKLSMNLYHPIKARQKDRKLPEAPIFRGSRGPIFITNKAAELDLQ